MRDPFELAVEHHQAGRLEQAEDLYKKVLTRQPHHADAIHNLGVIALQSGRNDLAVVLLRRAVMLAPMQARGYSNLGNALIGLGQVDDAIKVYRDALELEPNHRDALSNLGVALMEKGENDEAASIYRRLIARDPGNVEAHYNLGLALIAMKRDGDAIQCFRRAIMLRPDYAAARHNLATLLSAEGWHDEAIAELNLAINANPRFTQAYYQLGNTLILRDRPGEALDAYQQLLALDPSHVEGHYRLGECQLKQQQLDGAIASFRRCVALNPDHVDAHAGIGRALKDTGLLSEAVAHLRQAVRLQPDSASLHSYLILLLYYCPALDNSVIEKELAAWSNLHAQPDHNLAVGDSSDRSPHRRLRIGYVSADFNYHSVGRFMIPIVARHDRMKFEIHLFSGTIQTDEVTGWFKENADHWHEVGLLGDSETAGLIVAEQIDILVDLALHTPGHRLQVFARKPAPLQATHLAYCGTSGLKAMDYALADQYLCPPGLEAHFVEQVARLPACYWCYRPLPNYPDPGPLPALSSGHVTFGCLNNFCKVNNSVLGVWSALLRLVPNSKLVMYSKEGSHRNRVRDFLSAAGVDPGRLTFVPLVPILEYTQQYLPFDICLDPFPFCGGTTTCDALWMGVPVVSLAGQTPVSRGGLSILSNIGLPELVAESTEQYIRIAVELAADLPRLTELRSTLRQRMQNSPLMDERQYVLDLEAIYREMWVRWCLEKPEFRNPNPRINDECPKSE